MPQAFGFDTQDDNQDGQFRVPRMPRSTMPNQPAPAQPGMTGAGNTSGAVMGGTPSGATSPAAGWPNPNQSRPNPDANTDMSPQALTQMMQDYGRLQGRSEADLASTLDTDKAYWLPKVEAGGAGQLDFWKGRMRDKPGEGTNAGGPVAGSSGGWGPMASGVASGGGSDDGSTLAWLRKLFPGAQQGQGNQNPGTDPAWTPYR